jgi:starch synthase
MAHHIQAGCDIMLAPSKYEPCGLTHLYSLTYGTIPVARNTGGLSDTITDHKKPKGNGFLFNKFDVGEFMKAINTAIGVYRKNRPKWNQMIRNGMSEDFSWKVSATKYMSMYKKLISSK